MTEADKAVSSSPSSADMAQVFLAAVQARTTFALAASFGTNSERLDAIEIGPCTRKTKQEEWFREKRGDLAIHPQGRFFAGTPAVVALTPIESVEEFSPPENMASVFSPLLNLTPVLWDPAAVIMALSKIMERDDDSLVFSLDAADTVSALTAWLFETTGTVLGPRMWHPCPSVPGWSPIVNPLSWVFGSRRNINDVSAVLNAMKLRTPLELDTLQPDDGLYMDYPTRGACRG